MMQHEYGDDFQPGERFLTPAITVTEAHLVSFSGLTCDFFPLHADAVHAAGTQFGERLVHGPFVFALAVGLASYARIFGDSAIAWLGADSLRMHVPVKIGDTLHASVSMRETRATRNPSKGIQVWSFAMINQRDETVLTFDHRIMVHLRGGATP